MDRSARRAARREVMILSHLKHPNIIHHYESFEDAGKLCIVTEYAAGGDLNRRLMERGGQPFPEEHILAWLVELCSAMHYVHKKKVLHRDLKLQNIFLSSMSSVRLGDFGIARVLKHTFENAQSVVGTPYYLSPEICMSKPYNHKSDVWAIGCVLYELCAQCHAFEASSITALVHKILHSSPAPLPDHYSADLRGLVSLMLSRSPSGRPPIHAILQLPFLRSYVVAFVERTKAQFGSLPRESLPEEMQSLLRDPDPVAPERRFPVRDRTSLGRGEAEVDVPAGGGGRPAAAGPVRVTSKQPAPPSACLVSDRREPVKGEYPMEHRQPKLRGKRSPSAQVANSRTPSTRKSPSTQIVRDRSPSSRRPPRTPSSAQQRPSRRRSPLPQQEPRSAPPRSRRSRSRSHTPPVDTSREPAARETPSDGRHHRDRDGGRRRKRRSRESPGAPDAILAQSPERGVPPAGGEAGTPSAQLKSSVLRHPEFVPPRVHGLAEVPPPCREASDDAVGDSLDNISLSNPSTVAHGRRSKKQHRSDVGDDPAAPVGNGNGAAAKPRNAKFTMEGKTLNLRGVSSPLDPAAHRMEALRQYLSDEMGEDAFLKLYQELAHERASYGITEEHPPDRVLSRLGETARTHLDRIGRLPLAPLVDQLLQSEEEEFGQ